MSAAVPVPRGSGIASRSWRTIPFSSAFLALTIALRPAFDALYAFDIAKPPTA